MKSNYIHETNNAQILRKPYTFHQDERSIINEPETPQSVIQNPFFGQLQQNYETDSFIISNNAQPQLSQRSASPVSFLGGRKKNKSFLSHYANTKKKRNTSGSRNYTEIILDMPPKRISFKFTEFSLFYSTPITKYWISLIFRLMYLIVFSLSVSF